MTLWNIFSFLTWSFNWWPLTDWLTDWWTEMDRDGQRRTDWCVLFPTTSVPGQNDWSTHTSAELTSGCLCQTLEQIISFRFFSVVMLTLAQFVFVFSLDIWPPVCWSVRPSVLPSVRPSIHLSICRTLTDLRPIKDRTQTEHRPNSDWGNFIHYRTSLSKTWEVTYYWTVSTADIKYKVSRLSVSICLFTICPSDL